MASVTCLDSAFLVREARNGNHGAFEVLVRQHDRLILRLALRLTGSEHDAQDIYQEAVLKAYRNLPGFRQESCFSTWPDPYEFIDVTDKVRAGDAGKPSP